MDLDDWSPESEVGIAAAVVAALLLSPRVRGLLRRGAVAALAGVLTTGDAVAGWARRLEGGGEQGDTGGATFVRELVREARGELEGRKQLPEH